MTLDFQPLPKVFPKQQLWGCIAGVFTFVISKDEDGFTASAKAMGEGYRHEIGGYCAHKSLIDAKDACQRFLREKN